jgi:dGTPase
VREARASGRRNESPDDTRSEFARDLDRIPYNRYWLRLAEITQVYSEGGLGGTAAEQPLQHNRMTHSQKVAQVGRRLTEHLLRQESNATGIGAAGGMDVNVVEAACLTHDLGHPPFGHVGEEELDRLARQAGLADGFEGNAQTFRILTALSVHDPQGAPQAGMDLTAATLAASTKYPWARDERPDADGYASRRWRKYGFYAVDRPAFEALVAPLLPPGGGKTLEAQVMDWADDISYAVHDIEDFYKAGLIPLDRLRHVDRGTAEQVHEAVQPREMSTFERYANNRLGDRLTDPERAWRLFARYAVGFPEGPYEGRALQDRIMDQLASRIITDSTKATAIRADGTLHRDPDALAVVDILKQLTWHYVVERPDLATQQAGQRRRLAAVFLHWLAQAAAASATHREDPLTGKRKPLTASEMWVRRNTLPVRLDEFVQPLLRRAEGGAERRLAVARGVVDYVASLREKEIDRYAELLGPAEPPDRAGPEAEPPPPA